MAAHSCHHIDKPSLPYSHPTLQIKPAIYVTYNGDFFDWPFIGAFGCLGEGCMAAAGPVPSKLWLPSVQDYEASARQHFVQQLSEFSSCRNVPRSHLPLTGCAETRAAKNGMDMGEEIGFTCDRKANQTLSRWGLAAVVGLRHALGSLQTRQ